MIKKTSISILILFHIFLISKAQNNDYFDIDFLRYNNHIYKKNIKTVLLHKKDWPLSMPVIALNSDEKLQLSFDELNTTEETSYSFSVIHCNSAWEKSDIMSNDYISGYNEMMITNVNFSFNTLQPYIHYSATFPNNDFNITKSGNYILKVYKSYEPDSIIFVHRFLVIDNQTTINATVKKATIAKYTSTHQEIDFTINTTGTDIQDPHSQLEVKIMQNFRWDTEISGLKPKFIRNKELDYNYEKENIFWANNEFRFFNIKSLRFEDRFVQNIIIENNENHVYLSPGNIKQFAAYSSEEDINGQYIVHVQEYDNNDTEADYAYVHFTLPYSPPYQDGNFYIYGALTGWQLNNTSKMTYNYVNKAYETVLYLKQGYYNYQYVLVEDDKKPNAAFIEGSHYETENDYYILVYYQSYSDRYQQLIGYKKINSHHSNTTNY